MNLKELRKENKKSQEDISKYLNVARTTYIGYEQQTSEPTIDTLCKLADYYDVSLDYLVGREYANEFAYLSEQEKIIVATFRQMNNDNKLKYIAEGQGILIAQN